MVIKAQWCCGVVAVVWRCLQGRQRDWSLLKVKCLSKVVVPAIQKRALPLLSCWQCRRVSWSSDFSFHNKLKTTFFYFQNLPKFWKTQLNLGNQTCFHHSFWKFMKTKIESGKQKCYQTNPRCIAFDNQLFDRYMKISKYKSL